MSHILYRIGNFSGRHPWRVISAWMLAPSPSSCSTVRSAELPTRASRLPGAESQRAADAIQDRFPQETLYSSNVIFHSDEGLTSPETKQRGRAGRHRAR